MARLEAIERIVVRSGVFDRPDGFEIEPNFYPGGSADLLTDGNPGGRPVVIGYSYALFMFAPTRKIAGEGNTCLRIAVNEAAGANQLPYGNAHGHLFMEWDTATRSPEPPTCGIASPLRSAVGSTSCSPHGARPTGRP
jgi:hypothetical protein